VEGEKTREWGKRVWKGISDMRRKVVKKN